jgi:transposase InsO family protein
MPYPTATVSPAQSLSPSGIGLLSTNGPLNYLSPKLFAESRDGACRLIVPITHLIAEHMVGTLRREVLDRTLIVNERHLHRVLAVYLEHFNAGRPHRSLGQLTPAQAETHYPEPINLAQYRIRRKPILNGLTSQYERAS